MVIPELGSGVWIGIGFGLIGISFWVVGLFLFDRLVDRYGSDGHPGDDDSLGDR